VPNPMATSNAQTTRARAHTRTRLYYHWLSPSSSANSSRRERVEVRTYTLMLEAAKNSPIFARMHPHKSARLRPVTAAPTRSQRSHATSWASDARPSSPSGAATSCPPLPQTVKATSEGHQRYRHEVRQPLMHMASFGLDASGYVSRKPRLRSFFRAC